MSDPFGNFGRSTILKYLESCYAGEAGKFNQNKGGAGLGIFQIMEMSDLFVVNVHHKTKTEVIVMFNLDPNKSKSTKTTSLHYFSD